MLKDFFSKQKNKDKILNLIDGYVDIKAYNIDENGEKKLVYHDTGDNTVTCWMRQIILQLLAGESFINDNNEILVSYDFFTNNEQTSRNNACLLSGEQYFGAKKDIVDLCFYKHNTINNSKGLRAIFPTKVLFGTGKEYIDYEAFAKDYSTEDVKKVVYNFINDSNSNTDVDSANYLKNYIENHNTEAENGFFYSTFGQQGIHTIEGASKTGIPTFTVNDLNNETLVTSSSDLYNRFSVVGPIKTTKLNQNGTDIKGFGYPCFIYFKRKGTSWSYEGANVKISDTGTSFKNTITFTISMPSQSGSDDFYPYNGYTLKQIGLYNDTKLATAVADNDNEHKASSHQFDGKMDNGTLLAIKNIAPITKQKDQVLIFSWTLTL